MILVQHPQPTVRPVITASSQHVVQNACIIFFYACTAHERADVFLRGLPEALAGAGQTCLDAGNAGEREKKHLFYFSLILLDEGNV